MASQTGECEISSIEGNIVRGTFKSIYDKNVGSGNIGTAAMILKDAFSSLVGKSVSESALRDAITEFTLDTPNTPKSNFTIKVSDPKILEGLIDGWWESYYVG